MIDETKTHSKFANEQRDTTNLAISDILLITLNKIVDVNENKVLQIEMLFPDFFLSR